MATALSQAKRLNSAWSRKPGAAVHANLAALPYQVDAWTGRDGAALDAETVRILAADSYLNRSYTNGASVPTWPQFTENDRQVMHFNKKPHPGPVPSASALEVLDTYFAWRRTPEGDAWAK